MEGALFGCLALAAVILGTLCVGAYSIWWLIS